MFGLGPGELLIILAIALIFLGPKRLPDVATSLGKAIRSFRKATNDLTAQLEIDEEVKAPLRELQSALRDEPSPSLMKPREPARETPANTAAQPSPATAAAALSSAAAATAGGGLAVTGVPVAEEGSQPAAGAPVLAVGTPVLAVGTPELAVTTTPAVPTPQPPLAPSVPAVEKKA
jgi:TatA/E family protein of Tat protein translocase